MRVDVFACYFALFVEYFLKTGFDAAFDGFCGPSSGRIGRGVGLGAASLPAIAPSAFRVDDCVAEFGAVFVAAVDKLSVVDDASAS